jgi:hypothetical protein
MLPPDGAALFAEASDDLYGSFGWYETVIAAGVPKSVVPCLVLVRLEGIAAALVPLQSLDDGTLCSLTTPYTCLYRPLIAPALDAAGLHRVGVALAGLCRQFSTLRLDCLDADWPSLAPFCNGLRQGGLVALRFAHFGNWHEPVAGLSWEQYLASRDGTLRETIRRRAAKIARDPALRLALFRTQAEIEPGIAAFEAVYAKSWKEPEPFPQFNARLIRLATQRGILRLAVMFHAEQPIAVQLWVVTGGTASVLKLAHDEAFKPLSPGTVLSAWVIRSLLDDEHVAELDYGRGDAPYKQGWTSLRRQRIGLLLVNPRRLDGLRLLARHWLGALRRRLRPAA